jgi:D-alanine-D-alanine ligase
MNYNSKWEENSFEYENTQRSYECAHAPVELMQELALKCWDIFDLRGYARVDMRLAESGEVWIIEINANPCITPTSGYIGAVEEAGYTPTDFVRDMLGVALNVRR